MAPLITMTVLRPSSTQKLANRLRWTLKSASVTCSVSEMAEIVSWSAVQLVPLRQQPRLPLQQRQQRLLQPPLRPPRPLLPPQLHLVSDAVQDSFLEFNPGAFNIILVEHLLKKN